MTHDPRTDLAAFIETALTEVCFCREDSHPLDATIDRYFTPGYTQCTDGALSDRNGFAAHIRALRAVVADGTIKVREAVLEGSRIADRHEVSVTKRDGTTSHIEVYLFGQLADDGRLHRVNEITRLVAGSEDGAGLAQVR